MKIKIINVKPLRVILLFLLMGLHGHSFAGETYLCITEAAGGVKFNSYKKQFEGTAFDVNTTEKILVQREDNNTWKAKDFGSKFSNYFNCKASSEKGVATYVECKSIGGTFEISLQSLRFYSIYYVPALVDTSKYSTDKNIRELFDHNTPSISVGSCSSL